MSKTNQIGLQEYLSNAQVGLNDLNEQTSKEIVNSALLSEGQRLKDFTISVLSEAGRLLNTDLFSHLVNEQSYFLPPLPRPFIRFRPDDKYYLKFATRAMLECNGFNTDWVVPKYDCLAGLDIQFAFNACRGPYLSEFDINFEISFEETLKVFEWLFNQWRRPMCQLLRGVSGLELWGNGITLEVPGVKMKDPERLLQFHMMKQKDSNDSIVSMRKGFNVNDSDKDVILTVAVFVAIFDSIYRLTTSPANPDRFLHHYQTLVKYLPKVPFRITSIFPFEKQSSNSTKPPYCL